MKKQYFTIIFLGLIILLTSSCDNFVSEQANPCADQILIQNLQNQVTDLQKENEWLRQQIIYCQEGSTRRVTQTRPSGPTRPSNPQPDDTKRPSDSKPNDTKQQPDPARMLTPEPSNSASSNTLGRANLSKLYNDGTIQFCVMANNDGGLHFPELAMMNGVTFTSVKGNPDKNGHNWLVEPVPYIEGDYGITTDGVFFVSNELIARVLNISNKKLSNLQIKAPFSKWQLLDMKLVDDYWIYKAI